MTTFSQLVDELTRETRRPDMQAEIATYLNQTLREVHITPDRGNAVLYASSLKETQFVCTASDRQYWLPDHPARFQALQAVRYDSINVCDETQRWVSQRKPGIAMANLQRYWYRSGERIYFAGYGGLNAVISLAWYEYPQRFVYYPVARRPAYWSDDLQRFEYHEDYAADEESQATAQGLVSHWLLARWVDVVSEGVRAKLYKRLGETERARTCYSLYGTLRAGLVASESIEVTGIA